MDDHDLEIALRALLEAARDLREMLSGDDAVVITAQGIAIECGDKFMKLQDPR